MQKLEHLMAERVGEVVSSSATHDEVVAWLGAPTDSACQVCGVGHLKRFEALNGRCESCRIAWLESKREHDAAERPIGSHTAEPECELCTGTGWRSVGDGDRVTRCSCAESSGDDLILVKLSRAGVPPEYRTCSFATWTGPAPVEAKTFSIDPDRAKVLFLYGAPGRGKTHLATAVLRKLIESGLTCYWIDCGGFIDDMRSILGRGADEEYDAELWKLREADVVLFDDLGARRQTDYAVDVVDGLIRWRHSHQLPMIVTSNRSLRGLVTPAEQGGLGRQSQIASRLRGAEIELTGRDHRA